MTTSTSMRLGYLVFDVRSPRHWQRFCEDMLGLPTPAVNDDGSRGYRLDEACQRLIVAEGAADDLAALGLECADDRALDALLERIDAAGVAILPGDDALHRSRRVRRLYRLADPQGNGIELYCGPQRAEQAFSSSAFPRGFRTGELGIGHAVLVSRRLEEMEDFYREVLGFGVSERLDTRVGPIAMKGVFLHCNRRHHSLALFDLPSRKRLHHFMLQANDLCDVGIAFERARRGKVPLSLGLGQHPDPDGTFSFYGATPSGFDFEIGAGGKEIDPGGWREQASNVTSTWGHEPRLRLQLKMATELIARMVARRGVNADR